MCRALCCAQLTSQIRRGWLRYVSRLRSPWQGFSFQTKSFEQYVNMLILWTIMKPWWRSPWWGFPFQMKSFERYVLCCFYVFMFAELKLWELTESDCGPGQTTLPRQSFAEASSKPRQSHTKSASMSATASPTIKMRFSGLLFGRLGPRMGLLYAFVQRWAFAMLSITHEYLILYHNSSSSSSTTTTTTTSTSFGTMFGYRWER